MTRWSRADLPPPAPGNPQGAHTKRDSGVSLAERPFARNNPMANAARATSVFPGLAAGENPEPTNELKTTLGGASDVGSGFRCAAPE